MWQLDHLVKTTPLRKHGGPAYLYGAIRRLAISTGTATSSAAAASTTTTTTTTDTDTTAAHAQNIDMHRKWSVNSPAKPPPGGKFTQKARCLKSLQHASEVLCVKLFSEGVRGHARLATGTASGTLSYFDLKTGVCMKSITQAHRGPVKAVDVNKHYIVSGGVDHLVNIWNTASGSDTPIKSLRHTGPVLCVQLDSLRVVSGAQDGKVRIWNLLSGSCIRIFRGNSNCDPIVSLSFGDHRSICVNTQTSMHVLYFDTTNETKKASLDQESELSDPLSTRDQDVRIESYKNAVPLHRQATLLNFSGQWRSDGKHGLSRAATPQTFSSSGIRVTRPVNHALTWVLGSCPLLFCFVFVYMDLVSLTAMVCMG